MAKRKITPDLIDKSKFETLVRLGLSDEELYTFFMVSSGALYGWIKKVYETRSPLVLLKKMRVEGKIDFMVKQRKLAERNPAISIWIGKNYYEQTDGKEEESERNDFEDLNPLVELLKDDDNGNSNN